MNQNVSGSVYSINNHQGEQMNKPTLGNLLLFIIFFLTACEAFAGSDLKTIKAGDNYRVLAGSKLDSKNPLQGTLTLEIEVLGDWKHNEKAPIVIKIQPHEDMSISNQKLLKKDASIKNPKQVRFQVPFRLAKKGPIQIELSFDFVLCTETVCQKKRFSLPYTLANL